MKGPLLAALLALAPAPPTAGPGLQESARELFAEAVDAYRRGALEEAELRWRAVLEHAELPPLERARVAYDLGNVAWRAERPMEAVGWYTRALRLDPRNADARANLELARASQGLEPHERGDLRSSLRRLVGAVRPHERRWAVALCGLLLLGALVGEALRGSAAWRRTATALAVVFLLACTPWLAGMLAHEGEPLLVVATPGAGLRSEPSEKREPVGEVVAGQEVQRIDSLTGWVRVETADGSRGWVPEEAVFPLGG